LFDTCLTSAICFKQSQLAGARCILTDLQSLVDVNKLLSLSLSLSLALSLVAPPRGGVTRQGVELTDLQSLLDCQKTSLSRSLFLSLSIGAESSVL
jgi:hypothetical protein